MKSQTNTLDVPVGETNALVKIAVFSKVSGNDTLRLEVGSRPLKVTRIGGNIFVTHALCPHEEADLSLGMLSDAV